MVRKGRTRLSIGALMLKEVKYTALVIESEQGWGRKVDEVKEFDTPEERDKFVREYNSKLPNGPAPDWYMMAQSGADIIKDLERPV